MNCLKIISKRHPLTNQKKTIASICLGKCGTKPIKLLKIENVGTFVKVEFNTPNWNGEFKKYNAIYADNGCGKTTFTQLLKSCKSMRDAKRT